MEGSSPTSPTGPCRNVVICGLTAAGKTTHSQLLARELGYEYVSGTGTLARLLGIETDADPPRWADIADRISEQRTDDVDRALEVELVRTARERGRQVFDAWALPWTFGGSGLIRIWIESTLETRSWKCFISQGSEPLRSVEECRAFVREKDDFNRDLFLRTQGFDLYGGRDVFNVVLDNTSVIESPTEQAARAGIARFAPIVRTAFEVCHGLRPESELWELDRRTTGGSCVSRVACR